MSQKLGSGFRKSPFGSNVVAALALRSPKKKDCLIIVMRTAQGTITFSHAHFVEYTDEDDFKITVEAERVHSTGTFGEALFTLATKRTARIPRRFLLGLGRESVYGYNPNDYEDEEDDEEF